MDFPAVPSGWNRKNTMIAIVLFYNIREGYHYHFKQGFGPLCKIMRIHKTIVLGLFLLELKRHREKLLNNNTTTTAHPQRNSTTCFSSNTFHAMNQSRATQVGSRPRHSNNKTTTAHPQRNITSFFSSTTFML